MKILQFTIPVAENKTIILKEELMPAFYPHLHRHHEVQLSWVIKGAGTLVADNDMCGFADNDIFWISANQSHVFNCFPQLDSNGNQEDVHRLDIFFNPEGPLAAFFDIPELKSLKNFIRHTTAGFRVPAAKVNTVSQKMLAVKNNSGVEQFLCFLDLLKELSGYKNLVPLSSGIQTTRVTDDEGLRIASIYDYVMQHYNQQITLEDVSKVAFMTPQAFCRYFKKHTHHTLVSFVNQVRINKACKELVEHKYDSIASIAYNTGFNSITNFNRVFKSVTKKSPKEYVDSFDKNVRYKTQEPDQ
jgi:AraC-like DNA-binding protein